MRQLPSILCAAAAAVAGFSVAYAQTAPAPAPAARPAPDPNAPANMKNRKALPAGITRKELGDTMRAFTAALGVKCDYCHVPPDFASDANPRKNVARGMIRMAMDINRQLPTIADKDSRVSCYTCHRGSPHPALKPEPPMTVAPAKTPAP